MPTYHEILTTDLSTLTTAAERWEGMAKEMGKQETAYRKDVHGITLRPTWAGESRQAANARFGVRVTEYQSAQTEARQPWARSRQRLDEVLRARGSGRVRART
ncbi:hypothetical protein ABT298_14905 [Streptomyces sp. NPDC001034]|uniref:hypothetical protein n=1 Tax=Streptomyces sp. NPDC001034 TaxID=3154375 RepID=UPI003333E0A2